MNYKQLQLFELPPQTKIIHDPYWDELEANTSDILDPSETIAISESEILGTSIKIAPQHSERVGEQLSLDDPPYKSVGEHVQLDTLKVAPQHDAKSYQRNTEATHWVEKYWVERVGNIATASCIKT